MFKSQYIDLDTKSTQENYQSQHLRLIQQEALNLYDDKNTFTVGTMATNTSSHISADATKQHFIQVLDNIVDEKYNKIFVFGKYNASAATDKIDIQYSNNRVGGSASPYNVPSNVIFGESIRGKLKHDGFYHFTHTIEAVPRYVAFFNPNSTSLTNVEIHYVKLQ